MSIRLITFPTLQCCSANGPCRPDGQTPCPLTAHLTKEVCCLSASQANEQVMLLINIIEFQ